MANTVYGPYTKGASLASGPYTLGGNYTNQEANNAETQSYVALHSVNPDLIGAAFVASGITAVKDPTTATQLNVLPGKAYLLMTDGSLCRIDVVATSFTVSLNSTTYYLDLNPDGTWSFTTSHSIQSNYLPIAQVTTDGSHNIASVTDKRVTTTSFLSSQAMLSQATPGGLTLPSPLYALLTQNSSAVGVVTGGVTFGQVGALAASMDGAASFDGTSGYITLPSNSIPSGNNPWTLECWAKISANPASTVCALGIGTSGVSKGTAQLNINSSGQPLIGVGGGVSVNGTSAISLNAWHHLAATWDGTTLTLYVDGVSSGTPGTPGALSESGAFATIASFPQSAPSASFAGMLDEVAIYTSALSSSRVSAHYSAATSTTTDTYATTVLSDSPLRYYRLGDAVGSTSAACTQSATATQILSPAGAFKTIGGQATVGSLGAAALVAQSSVVHVTDNASHTLLTFTPSTAGWYRLNFDGVSPSVNGAVTLAWTSGVNSAARSVANAMNSNPNGNAPITFYAASGAAITVSYQNSVASPVPNDYAVAILERLS